MHDGRFRRFLGGLSLGYVQAIAVAALGLWLTPFYLRRIGEHDFGLWLVVAQVLSYLALADLGIVAILPREVAHATGSRGQHESPNVADVVTESVRVIAWQMPLVVVGGLIAWVTLVWQWPELQGPLTIVTVGFVLSFPFRVFPAVLQGLQELPYLGRIQLAGWVVSTVVTVALVHAGYGLFALVIGWIVTQGFTAGLALLRVITKFPGVMPQPPFLGPVPGRDRVVRGLWVSVNQIAQVLLNGTDFMLVGWMMGPAAVVMYSCTGRLASVLANQPQMFMQMAVPVLSELRASASRERLFDVSSSLSQVMLLGSGAVACVVLGINQGFVTWWVGSQQFAGHLVTVLVLLVMMLRHLNLAVSYTLYSLGYERRLALTSIADGALTLVSAIVTIRFLGLPGAVVASMIGVSLISLPSNLRALATDQGVSVLVVLRPLRSWSLRCGLMIAIVAASSTMWTPRGFSLLVAASTIGALYCAVMLPILSAPPIGPRLAQILAGFFAWVPVPPKAVKPATHRT